MPTHNVNIHIDDLTVMFLTASSGENAFSDSTWTNSGSDNEYWLIKIVLIRSI